MHRGYSVLEVWSEGKHVMWDMSCEKATNDVFQSFFVSFANMRCKYRARELILCVRCIIKNKIIFNLFSALFNTASWLLSSNKLAFIYLTVLSAFSPCFLTFFFESLYCEGFYWKWLVLYECLRWMLTHFLNVSPEKIVITIMQIRYRILLFSPLTFYINSSWLDHEMPPFQMQ